MLNAPEPLLLLLLLFSSAEGTGFGALANKSALLDGSVIEKKTPFDYAHITMYGNIS